MKIFKYLSPERVDVLENQALRFTQANYLNDPFEHLPFVSQLVDEAFTNQLYKETLFPLLQQIAKRKLCIDDIPEEYRNAIPDNVKEEVFNYTIGEALNLIPAFHPKNLLNLFAIEGKDLGVDYSTLLKDSWNNKFGVLSLTKSNDNLTMWSHYTRNHEGFVIEFNPSNNYFNKTKTEKDLLRKLNEVKYSEARPKLTLIDSNIIEEEMLESLFQNILLTKSKHWQYEEEVRFIQILEDSDKIIKSDGQEIHLFGFDPSAIKCVFLGVNISTSFKNNLLLILNEARYMHVNIYQGVLSKTEYKIEFIEERVNL
ncbi:DUF2971 domain-containing protein [Pontibacter sp. BT310]|uniref:DUF2971 domain-containing protein n=1 Tax=Pontibacter populi TaxID=890055 RepID=A0ABS6XB98_9BACT|nr:MULTISPECIES: DUF2971 domain-containing protein [Pontibacter]MBJ6118385.1 DUF2971 domain-containing protein [Pontibacter sp. BT310]MBR0570813.1 DUF2971 domain-containing protein [Microvirga sp. STS03]MBW3365239.1 DUF2971 domain-containing protein [Pontibacter populi]